MTPEEIIQRLLKEHFFLDKGKLHWNWNDDVSLAEVDNKLNKELLKYL